ncbi:hypothetical protein AARI_29860 [Glutamicibacter arilaitensis Re117]|uniref:Uncharacterized protein n=1 Tax=Glutamicibacter arilaitensis (strain DSM 16368 / CIP 108037 / IAM 15318 / JCM 13566 / NCIMB 14258 / Re117) TaxID=861360 RepID=A0ABP1U8L1_GLUAR|nr:hypothetical protein [Glutamicibacter arilaitensis]CBT77185.1 hypothetical protein AARI_29860 [Glutamicibacter arilaitensis Re117]
MPGRLVRTQTAERVSELLGSREGRAHLAAHGWAQGMPIVMAAPTEPVNDVMGLVSMHGRSVLVAVLDTGSNELKFFYVSTPNPALQPVDPEKATTKIHELFARTEDQGAVTFRVKYWDSCAVALPIPVFHPVAATKNYEQRLRDRANRGQTILKAFD